MPARVACVVSQCKLRLDSCHNGWCILACHDALVVRQLWWWCVMHVGSRSAALCWVAIRAAGLPRLPRHQLSCPRSVSAAGLCPTRTTALPRDTHDCGEVLWKRRRHPVLVACPHHHMYPSWHLVQQCAAPAAHGRSPDPSMCLSCTRYLAIGPCLALLGRALRAPSHCTLKYHTCCGIVGEVAPQHVWGCWVAHVLSPTWISRKDLAGGLCH